MGIGGIRISPAQVFGNGAGEEDVFLEDHGHCVAQRFNIIILHIDAPDLYGTQGGIIESGNELDQGGFSTPGAADDADGFTASNIQIDVFKTQLMGVCRIAEADILKADRAV